MNSTQLIPEHEASRLFPSMSDEEYQELKADIALNGQREPITVRDGLIIDGRHRYRACLELSVEPKTTLLARSESIIRFVLSQNLRRRHLSASQKAAIAVQADLMAQAELEAKRRQSVSASKAGKVSASIYATELSSATIGDSNLNVPEMFPEPSLGLESRECVAGQFGTNPRYIQDAKKLRDEAPELLEQVKSGERTLPQAKLELRRREKRNQLSQLARQASPSQSHWEIRTGNCIDIFPELNDRYRLIFADPPYNVGIDYGMGKSADLMPDGQYMAWVEQWLIGCRDLLTDDGSLWVLIGDEYAAEYGVLLKRLGLTIRSWIKWFESFGVNCSCNFNRCSRHLFYCVKSPNQFLFHEDAVSRLSDRQVKYGDKRASEGGKIWDNIWGIEPAIPRLTGTCNERVPDFPTQLPLKLLIPIVLCATNPGDLILDPFNGSGTTGVAAIQNGRRYVGIEKSEKFAELARLRLKGVKQ
jgi:DNA modification methylase